MIEQGSSRSHVDLGLQPCGECVELDHYWKLKGLNSRVHLIALQTCLIECALACLFCLAGNCSLVTLLLSSVSIALQKPYGYGCMHSIAGLPKIQTNGTGQKLFCGSQAETLSPPPLNLDLEHNSALPTKHLKQPNESSTSISMLIQGFWQTLVDPFPGLVNLQICTGVNNTAHSFIAAMTCRD